MKIHIVGWSGINHSYSIIAEEYVKGLMQFPENKFYFTESKYYIDKWKKYKNSVFDEMDKPDETDVFDVTMHFTYPYDFVPDTRSKITIVFVTCEFNYITDFVDVDDICNNVFILTPSEYSKKGIVATGIPSSKIIVVSHSYDYIDSTCTVEQLRNKYSISKSDYVYFHNSSLTPNKNFISLLESFEKIYNINPNVTLFIKGNDNAYGSKNKLVEMIQTIKVDSCLNCERKIRYIGNDVSPEEMVEFYKLSDCYVSPFLAEGFNLPVLEALSHGKRVICTRGGPPDEFAKDGIFLSSKEMDTGSQMNVNGRNAYFHQNKNCSKE
jgi:glycosyltransferase involved in cell wall biosynthesis